MLAPLTLVALACAGDSRPPDTPNTAGTVVPPSATPAVPAATTQPPRTAFATSEPSPNAAPVVEARVIYRGPATRRAVALTFDAGADVRYTADILRTLRENGVRATFGVTGIWAEQNRDLLFAIAADGHQIINHTYDHRSFTGASTGEPPLTPEERALELSRAEVTVYRYTSRSTKPYFRPPYGDIDDSVLRDAAANRYDTVVMWTVDTLGWDGATAEQILQRAVELAEPGAIYVMHVGSVSQDALALRAIISALRADGYDFETIHELLTP